MDNRNQTADEVGAAQQTLPEHTIPVISASQRQGDVLILAVESVPRGRRISTSGIDVIRGDGSRNAHTLHVDATAYWEPGDGLGVLGYLEVTPGATAWLNHAEHPDLGIGSGCYRVIRQREVSATDAGVRYVAD
jgi:hypothetical protein